MGQILRTPPDALDTTQRVTLGGTQYQVRIYWQERRAAWYLDLSAADGTQIEAGRRLSPGYIPVRDVRTTGAPGGVLFVAGPDSYDVGDLGDALRVVYYDRSEFAAIAANTGIAIDL